MKKIVIFSLIGILNGLYNQILAQEYEFTCILSGIKKTGGPIPNASDFIPNETTTIKYIRMNIHFILLDDSDPDYPGNFTETDDGNGNNSYTGYDFAKDLIDKVNERLSYNIQMNMPPGNSTGVIDRKYRFILDAVYFHENSTYYYFPAYPNSVYSENGGEVINVYFNHNAPGQSGGHGHANTSGNRWVEMAGVWEKYINDGLASYLWVKAGGIIHESGHNLSLLHTMRTGGGVCYNNAEDYCDDTPTRGEIITNYGFDPCCGWGGGDSCSNNAMDYDGDLAMTPLQLGRVHWTLEYEMEEYLTCFFNISDLNICNDDFGYPQLIYIAENIITPGSSCSPQSAILESGEEAIFIAKDGVTLNPGFEVELGAAISIEFKSQCVF